MQALGVILLVIGVVISVRERKYMRMWRSSQPMPNQLATVLSQLVGTAGGIYLSLELLFSFLKIPEDWWSQSAFFVEPLAVISLLLAIVQPFGVKAWMRLRK